MGLGYFANTGHCRSGFHCRACRDLEGGRAWRESLGKAFRLPAGAPDFPCPLAHPWGYAPPAVGGPAGGPSAMEEPWLTARIEMCRGCGDWPDGADHCSLSPACTACYRRRPGAVCPANPPKWSPPNVSHSTAPDGARSVEP